MSDTPPDSISAPPAYPRADWRPAIVAALLAVLVFLFVQLTALRERLAVQHETIVALEKRTGALGKSIDRRFDETRQDLAAIRALLEKKP